MKKEDEKKEMRKRKGKDGLKSQGENRQKLREQTKSDRRGQNEE
jgi:hypothetical protein